MPLTPFQVEMLKVLAANRTEESHFAGGVTINASAESPRFSRDFDIFHEIAAQVVQASERDVASLRAAGFRVQTIGRTGEWERETTFRRAAVTANSGEVVEVDWAADSAYRFFPIERDARLGWRLHLFDAATKDPGFTPLSLLAMMRRFARIDPVELDKIRARDLDPVTLKSEWHAISEGAEAAMTALADARPEVPIGVAFVNAAGTPQWIDDEPGLQVHAPSVRGCWPTIRGRHDL